LTFIYDSVSFKKVYIPLERTEIMNKNEINLYVDDLRDCPDGFVVARNVDEAIYYLENYKVNILSLDHDLGADPLC
jgi:hypothetical protein